MASGSTSDMLITAALSVNYLQNIPAMTSMSEVLPEAISNMHTCKQNQQGYKKLLYNFLGDKITQQ